MHSLRTIELLAPARDKYIGMAAIAYGADAVYIGASRFGARAAAGNSVEDIRELCEMAHRYAARVYVTVNTVVADEELDDTERLIDELAAVGVDAVLLQDMGLVEYARNKIEIHASTQTDNRTAEKVEWLWRQGFSRAVLARELSLQEIISIHKSVPEIELEAFVHGALCVSYSGQCYASEHCFGRSANRGECAQMCRMAYSLENAKGETIVENQHLLSLKDLCRLDDIEQMMEAGVCSFKIEGRLKDVGYVKNVVAAYNEKINDVIRRHPEKFVRQSIGATNPDFQPNVNKSFNRGFTKYFLHEREQNIIQPFSPKSLGEPIGRVVSLTRQTISVNTTQMIHNGDGLCFFGKEHRLEGFKVNRASQNMIYPFQMPKGIKTGMLLYRNHDHDFQVLLEQRNACRRSIPVAIQLSTDDGVSLQMSVVGADIFAIVKENSSFDKAKKPQKENMQVQLTKLGNTPFSCSRIEISDNAAELFIPSSQLATMRRQCTDLLVAKIVKMNADRQRKAVNRQKKIVVNGKEKAVDFRTINSSYYSQYAYLYNVHNRKAWQFYAAQGKNIEKTTNSHRSLLMQCKHCLRYHFGMCRTHQQTSEQQFEKEQWVEPLTLRLASGVKFKLEFDCKHCQMNIYAL